MYIVSESQTRIRYCSLGIEFSKENYPNITGGYEQDNGLQNSDTRETSS